MIVGFPVPASPDTPVLTLAEGKLRAGLDWIPGDARDGLMANWIAAATQRVQDDTGLVLRARSFDVYFEVVVGGYPVALPVRPVSSIVSVSAVDSAGTAHAVPAPSYTLFPGSDAPIPARLTLTIDDTWPLSNLRAFQPWVIRLVAGWPTVADIPAPLINLVGLLTAHYATVGRDMTQVGHIIATTPLVEYERLIAPYQLVTVP